MRWLLAACGVLCMLGASRRAHAEPAAGLKIENRGADTRCLSLEGFTLALGVHTGLSVSALGSEEPGADEALVWLGSAQSGIEVGIAFGGGEVRRTFETRECGTLTEVVAAFVATMLAQLEEEPRQEPMAKALLDSMRHQRAKNLAEKLRTRLLLDARDIEDLEVRLSPRGKAGWHVVVGSTRIDCSALGSVLVLPSDDSSAIDTLLEFARPLVEKVRTCGPDAFPESREKRALRLYSTLLVAEKRKRDVSSTPLTAIYATEVGLFSIILSGAGESFSRSERWSYFAAGSFMLAGSTIPLLFYRNSDHIAGPIAEVSYLMGGAGIAFTMGRNIDGPYKYSPPLMLLGASLTAAAGLTVMQAIKNPPRESGHCARAKHRERRRPAENRKGYASLREAVSALAQRLSRRDGSTLDSTFSYRE
jgi:hypothetical protein